MSNYAVTIEEKRAANFYISCLNYTILCLPINAQNTCFTAILVVGIVTTVKLRIIWKFTRFPRGVLCII